MTFRVQVNDTTQAGAPSPVRRLLTSNRLHEVTTIVRPTVLAPHSRSRPLLHCTSPRRHHQLYPRDAKTEAVRPRKRVFRLESPVLRSGPTCAVARSTWRNVASHVLPQDQPYAALGVAFIVAISRFPAAAPGRH